MEAFFSLFTLIRILFFFSFVSIVLLLVSTNEDSGDSEITRKENELLHEISRIEKAELAVLKHLTLKEKKNRQKTIKIDELPLTKIHDVKVVDLRERRIVKRQRSSYNKIS